MIQPAGEVLRVAAVALVQTDDVPSRGPRLVRDAADVVGEARAFKAVQQQERRMLPDARMPMAVGEHARVWCNVEIADRRARQRITTRLRNATV